MAFLFLATLMLVSGGALQAQERQVIIRKSASAFEQEVERLARELMQKRREAIMLMRGMQRMQSSLQSAAAGSSMRAQLETSLRQVSSQLSALDVDGSRIQKRLSELCSANRKPEGYVGVVFSASVTPTRDDDGNVVLRFYDYPSIESVEPRSPAERGGLQGGDLILSMAGEDLRNREIVFSALLKPGNRIPVRIQRGGETRTLTVTVEPRPDDYATPCPWMDENIAAAFAPMDMSFSFTISEAPAAVAGADATARTNVRGSAPVVAGRAPAPPTSALPPVAPVAPLPPMGLAGTPSTFAFGGAQLILLSADIAESLGVEQGLLVMRSGRGSPAEQSGLRTGDVLVTIEGRALTSPSVFLDAIRDAQAREVRLQLVRKKKQLSTTLRW
ncbi:MAG: PDZ domain-containing protein [Gemmatimonadaceae bacterium]